MPRFETLYQAHGLPVLVRTDDPLIQQAAAEALGGFPTTFPRPGTPLEVIMQAVPEIGEVPLKHSKSAVLVRDTPSEAGKVSCRIYRDGARWVLDFGAAGRMALDTEGGRVEGWLVQPGRLPMDWAASFVLLAAIELLRTRGLFSIHGAALEKDGRGVLIVGASGAGKTTACLSLMRAGYGCLSDDHPLLDAGSDEMLLLPFPGRISVTDRTIACFPELSLAQETFRPDTRKRSFEVDAVSGFRLGGACKPAVIVFPRIVDWPESAIEKLPRARALEELLPQTLLVLDPVLAGRQFRVMGRLVQGTPTYRLHFGEDVTMLPKVIDRLLESLQSTRSERTSST